MMLLIILFYLLGVFVTALMFACMCVVLRRLGDPVDAHIIALGALASLCSWIGGVAIIISVIIIVTVLYL